MISGKVKPQDVGSSESVTNRVEDSRVSRRAALRRLGFTAGAAFLGMFAADDLTRLVLSGMERHDATRGIADSLAHEFRDAGIAYGQGGGGSSHCGINDVPCRCQFIDPETGTCPNPGPCGCCDPCLHCTPPDSNCFCMDVADYKWCCCKQAAINQYPSCVDCNGAPNGNPGCLEFNLAMAQCEAQHTQDTQNC